MSAYAPAAAMPRVLGLFDLAVLASAAMGPAYSLAVTLGPMVAAAGSLTPLSLVLLAAIMLCVAVTFSRMSAAIPSAGSSFTWIGAAFGGRAGTYGAWLLLLSNFFATMTTALPAASYTLDLFAPALASSPLWDAVVGVLWIAASGLLLYVGLRPTAFTTALFLIGELVVIGASVVAALLAHPAPEAPLPPLVLPNPIAGVVTAMVLGIWMIDGWEVSASASEESSGAADTSGRGGVAGLLLTTAFLLAAMFAYLRIGSIAGFAANSSDAMSYVAQRLGGGAWRIVVVGTVLVSTAATLWTTILYLSRSVYAMGREGVLPRPLGRLDARHLPSTALIVVSVAVAACTLLTGFSSKAADALNTVLNGTSVFLGLLFCLSSFAALRLVRGGHALAVIGGLALAAIIIVDVVNSDTVTRAIEIGGVLLGVPFAFWRSSSHQPHGPTPSDFYSS
jgi:amino acid transporter